MSDIGYELAKAIVIFLAGFLSGYLARGWKDRLQTNIDNEKLIALVVAFAWLLSVLADIFNPAYDTPLGLHGLMGIVVGFYYRKISKNDQGK